MVRGDPWARIAASGSVLTVRERIVEFFKSRNNRPATIEEIHKAVGGAEASIKGMLYKKDRNNGCFCRWPEESEYWRLSEKMLKRSSQSGPDDEEVEDSDTER